MGTLCKLAMRSGSGDGKNLGMVNSFLGKKGGSQLRKKHIIGAVAYMLG